MLMFNGALEGLILWAGNLNTSHVNVQSVKLPSWVPNTII